MSSLGDETYLGEEIHADQHLYEVVDDQCLFELVRFAVLHEAWAPRVDEVEVESDNREPRHGRTDKRPVICPGIYTRRNYETLFTCTFHGWVFKAVNMLITVLLPNYVEFFESLCKLLLFFLSLQTGAKLFTLERDLEKFHRTFGRHTHLPGL